MVLFIFFLDITIYHMIHFTNLFFSQTFIVLLSCILNYMRYNLININSGVPPT